MSPTEEWGASQRRRGTCAVLNGNDQNQKWPEGIRAFKYLCHITNYLCIAPHTSVQLTNFFKGVPQGKKLFEASIRTIETQKQRQKKSTETSQKPNQRIKLCPKKTQVFLMCTEQRSRNKGYVCTIYYHMHHQPSGFFTQVMLWITNNESCLPNPVVCMG